VHDDRIKGVSDDQLWVSDGGLGKDRVPDLRAERLRFINVDSSNLRRARDSLGLPTEYTKGSGGEGRLRARAIALENPSKAKRLILAL
jgi:hypothetical protein